MTAFVAANLPANVNSLAKVFAWSAGAFYSLNRTREYQESPNGILVPIVTMQDGQAGDQTERIIVRASFQLNANWREDPQPFWVNVISPTTANIPTQFLP